MSSKRCFPHLLLRFVFCQLKDENINSPDFTIQLLKCHFWEFGGTSLSAWLSLLTSNFSLRCEYLINRKGYVRRICFWILLHVHTCETYFHFILQLNTVLESLLSKVARYDQGFILAPMFSLRVCPYHKIFIYIYSIPHIPHTPILPAVFNINPSKCFQSKKPALPPPSRILTK